MGLISSAKLTMFLSFQSLFLSPLSGLSLVPPAAETDKLALQTESVTRGRRRAMVQAPTAMAATQCWAGSAPDQGVVALRLSGLVVVFSCFVTKTKPKYCN